MKIISRFASLAAFFLLPLVLHAAPSDALSVLQRCGPPITDTVVDGSGNYPGPQRVLTYGNAALHFQQDNGGWNFIFTNAVPGGRIRDRTQTEQRLPCFGKAMYDVQLHATSQTIQAPSAPAPTWSQQIAQHINQLSPLMLAGILLLYFLPTIIGILRRPAHLSALILINLLAGWTVLGWVIALMLAFGARRERDQESVPSAPPRRGKRKPARKLLGAFLTPDPNFLPFTAYSQPLELGEHPSAAHRVPVSTRSPEMQSASSSVFGAPRSGSFSSVAPAPYPPEPAISWTEFYEPHRFSRVEVVSTSQQVTIYDIHLSQRGTDPLDREVIGGYIGKTFMVFLMEDVLRIRELAA